MTEKNKNYITTSIRITKETNKWLRVYMALREISSLGDAIENIIADKRTVENLQNADPVPDDFLEEGD